MRREECVSSRWGGDRGAWFRGAGGLGCLGCLAVVFASDGKRREEEAVVASVAVTGERGRNKREKSRGVYVQEQKQRLRQRILYLGVRGLDGDV